MPTTPTIGEPGPDKPTTTTLDGSVDLELLDVIDELARLLEGKLEVRTRCRDGGAQNDHDDLQLTGVLPCEEEVLGLKGRAASAGNSGEVCDGHGS